MIYTSETEDSDKLSQMQTEINLLKSRMEKQEVSLSIVSSWSDVMFKDINSLQDQMHHNVSRHMQNELVISGIKQT